MDQKSQGFKVGFASALGAFIGALIALELSHNWWWLGMLAGGAVGYLAYEFKSLLAAIPRAWRAATNWRPDWEIFGRIASVFGVITMVSSFPGAVLVPGSVWLLKAYPPPFPKPHDLLEVSSLVAILSLILGLGILVSCALYLEERGGHFQPWRFALRVNALTVVPWTLYGIAWLSWQLLKAIPRILRWSFITVPLVLGRFAKHLALMTYSDERLLCAVSAAGGAATGYFYGNAAIGAFAGLILGLGQYELLSRRLLAPAIARWRAGG